MKEIPSLDFVLAGGKGERLYPLTRDRVKPAVPFAKYRFIDFALNNHVNSGSRNIVVLAQYKLHSLIRHIRDAWAPVFEREGQEFIKVRQPEHSEYKGTADAVCQNVPMIETAKPEIVTVFCGDHIYLMDITQMKKYHLDSRADLTIAALPIERDVAAGTLGVIVANERGDVVDFQEKPANPALIAGMQNRCWASMGNYVFNTAVLIEALGRDSIKETVRPENKDIVAKNPEIYSTHDFGFDIIRMLLRHGAKIKMYDFMSNTPDEIPVIGYWRDVGTLVQYIEANTDLTGPTPKFVVENKNWPIVTYDESHGKGVKGGQFALDSVLAGGVTIVDSLVERCVVGYNTTIGEKSELSDVILLGNNSIGRNVRIRKAVIDKGVKVPNGTSSVGVFHDDDVARGFTTAPNDYVVIPRNYQFR